MNKYYEFNFTEEQVKNEFLKFFVSNTKKFSNKFNLTESLNYFATLISKEIFNFKINSAAILLNEFINWRIHNKPDELGILLKDVVNRINLYAIANNDFVDITKDENFKELYEAFQNKSIDTIEQYEQGLLDNKEIPCKITEFSGTKLFQPITTIAFNKVDDENFKYFFTLKLRQMSVFKMNEFLDFHLNDIFKGDNNSFNSFIDNCLIEYEHYIYSSKIEKVKAEKSELIRKAEFIKYNKIEVWGNMACLDILYTEINGEFIEPVEKIDFFSHFLTNNPNPPLNIITKKRNFIELMDAIAPFFNEMETTERDGKVRCDRWMCQHFLFRKEVMTSEGISTCRNKDHITKQATINQILKKIHEIIKNDKNSQLR